MNNAERQDAYPNFHKFGQQISFYLEDTVFHINAEIFQDFSYLFWKKSYHFTLPHRPPPRKCITDDRAAGHNTTYVTNTSKTTNASNTSNCSTHTLSLVWPYTAQTKVLRNALLPTMRRLGSSPQCYPFLMKKFWNLDRAKIEIAYVTPRMGEDSSINSREHRTNRMGSISWER